MASIAEFEAAILLVGFWTHFEKASLLGARMVMSLAMVSILVKVGWVVRRAERLY